MIIAMIIKNYMKRVMIRVKKFFPSERILEKLNGSEEVKIR